MFNSNVRSKIIKEIGDMNLSDIPPALSPLSTYLSINAASSFYGNSVPKDLILLLAISAKHFTADMCDLNRDSLETIKRSFVNEFRQVFQKYPSEHASIMFLNTLWLDECGKCTGEDEQFLYALRTALRNISSKCLQYYIDEAEKSGIMEL